MTEKTQLDLIHLRRALLSMSASTEVRVAKAFDALFNRDAAAAKIVREGDDEIDEMELSLETECLEILALDQPMAGDLRFVLAAIRISMALERMADIARTVAKGVMKLDGEAEIEYPPAMKEMADECRAMVSDVIKSLADSDEKLAHEVRKRDQFVDRKNKEFFAWVVQTLRDGNCDVRAMIRLLIIGRSIERIADIAGNIAEDVIFAVGGSIVRHTPA